MAFLFKDYSGKAYKIKLRRDSRFVVKPEAEQLDGAVYLFTYGWAIDGGLYKGEHAMIPKRGQQWPDNAPVWMASGDLYLVTEG